jgi:hypothetical protein
MVIGYNGFTTDLILSENEITFNNDIWNIDEHGIAQRVCTNRTQAVKRKDDI